MRKRNVFCFAVTGLLAGSALAQPSTCDGTLPGGSAGSALFARGSSSLFPPPGSSNAVSPTREELERVNLKSVWTAYIPMDNRADGIGLIQTADNGQIFVQTKSGRLLALDEATGVPQWTFRYPEPYANIYPVGLTKDLAFAVNVNMLYCFARTTGALEFEYALPGLTLAGSGAPTAGPVADEKYVYLSLGSSRVAAFAYPKPFAIPQSSERAVGPDGNPIARFSRPPALGDQVAGRYGTSSNLTIGPKQADFPRNWILPELDQAGFGVSAMQKTPSVAALPRVTPPYTSTRQVSTPSITTVASLRQPYTSRPGHLLFNQQTPSISLMPPTVAAAAFLSNLRPKMYEPIAIWPATSPARSVYEPIQTETQLWFTTEAPLLYGLSKENGGRRGTIRLSDNPAAPAAGPLTVGEDLYGFFAQEDGAVLAVDLPSGGVQSQPKIEWRANVGGHLNHKPVMTTTGLYVSGDSAGVARIDYRTGEVLWRTGPHADRLLALNDEFAYVLDKRGNVQIYPRYLPNNPADPEARPVGRLPLPNFNVPVTNTQTDRILIGSDQGLLLCLRDASPKYSRPHTVAPPKPKPPELKPNRNEDEE